MNRQVNGECNTYIGKSIDVHYKILRLRKSQLILYTTWPCMEILFFSHNPRFFYLLVTDFFKAAIGNKLINKWRNSIYNITFPIEFCKTGNFLRHPTKYSFILAVILVYLFFTFWFYRAAGNTIHQTKKEMPNIKSITGHGEN